jgi:hypothetical protein
MVPPDVELRVAGNSQALRKILRTAVALRALLSKSHFENDFWQSGARL